MADELDGGLEQETRDLACEYLKETDSQLGAMTGEDYHGVATERFCPDAGTTDAGHDYGHDAGVDDVALDGGN